MFCIPIIAKDTDEALGKIERANHIADMVEIRLDTMDTFDLKELIQAVQRPVLVTYRSLQEGGVGTASCESRVRHIVAALEQGADLVDVELNLPLNWRKKIFDVRSDSGIVISTHIQQGTPLQPELEGILRRSLATGADIIKIVTRAQVWEDNFRVLRLISKAREQGREIVAFCMGPAGRVSRIFSHLMGGYLTFASLEKGEESADGQMPAREMKEILELVKPCP